MAKGIEAIYTQITDGTSSGISFNNIPQTYTDLLLKISVKATASSWDSIGLICNGDQSSRSNNKIQGSGSAASANRSTYRDFGSMGGTNTTANVFGSYEIYIPNYTLSGFHHILINGVNENNATEAYQYFTSFLESTGRPVTSLGISSSTYGTPFAQYTSATLYGISNR
jgi:hypothetical protein